MQVNIIIFGQLTDIVGNREISLTEISDTDQLLAKMHSMYPALRDIKYLIAVDKKVIAGNTQLNNNSVVALLPPFSGG